MAISTIGTNSLGASQVTPAKLSQPMTLGTAQASTSGTSIDFTGIPSWVKRITVMLQGVSTSGTSIPLIKIGPVGGVESSGYTGATWESNTSNANWSTGVAARVNGNAAYIISGVITFCLMNSSTNTWAVQGTLGRSDAADVSSIAGYKSLAGTLSIVRLTTVNGTDTFDAGSINILYEG